jgi:hypothetical protein
VREVGLRRISWSRVCVETASHAVWQSYGFCGDAQLDFVMSKSAKHGSIAFNGYSLWLPFTRNNRYYWIADGGWTLSHRSSRKLCSPKEYEDKTLPVSTGPGDVKPPPMNLLTKYQQRYDDKRSRQLVTSILYCIRNNLLERTARPLQDLDKLLRQRLAKCKAISWCFAYTPNCWMFGRRRKAKHVIKCSSPAATPSIYAATYANGGDTLYE